MIIELLLCRECYYERSCFPDLRRDQLVALEEHAGDWLPESDKLRLLLKADCQQRGEVFSVKSLLHHSFGHYRFRLVKSARGGHNHALVSLSLHLLAMRANMF